MKNSRKIGLSQQYLVINGVLPRSEAALDPLAAAICDSRDKRCLSDLPDVLRALPYDQVALKPFNLVGLMRCGSLLTETISSEVVDRRPARIHAYDAPSLSALVDVIAEDKHGLVMLMGKGGVGKTTLAAAVAVELARRGLPVHLTTSDPAANLSDTLNGSMDNLTVSRIDPQAETERYRQHVLETKGANLDAEGRACWKKTCVRPARRKSRCSRLFHASFERPARSSW